MHSYNSIYAHTLGFTVYTDMLESSLAVFLNQNSKNSWETFCTLGIPVEELYDEAFFGTYFTLQKERSVLALVSSLKKEHYEVQNDY